MKCKACNSDTKAYDVCPQCHTYEGELVRRNTLSGRPQAVFDEMVRDYGVEESWRTTEGLGLMSKAHLYTYLYNSAFSRFLEGLRGGFTPIVAFEQGVLRKKRFDRSAA